MVTSIVHVTIYNPTRCSMTHVVGHKWASLLAVFTTFVVSGLMHELIFYYMGRLRPAWEIMCFFLLHGFCLVVEIVLKKSFFTVGNRWRLPCLISGPLTLGFVIITSLWLFFPQCFRSKVDRGFGEYVLFYEYLNNVTHSFKEL